MWYAAIIFSVTNTLTQLKRDIMDSGMCVLFQNRRYIADRFRMTENWGSSDDCVLLRANAGVVLRLYYISKWVQQVAKWVGKVIRSSCAGATAVSTLVGWSKHTLTLVVQY